jgi:hypothetical protein
MPPKKKRSKSKSRTRPTQTQSQKVVVNIGGSSTKRKRRSGGSSMTPAAHAQNLVPFFIQAAQTHQPLVDYDRIAKMTGSLQEKNEPNRTPALQSQVPASVMAVAAAEERRAGPTSSGFESTPSESRLEQEPISRAPSVVSQRVASIEGLGKPEPLSRAGSSIGTSVSTKLGIPSGFAAVSTIKAMGAAEEQGRVSREKEIKEKQQKAQLSLQGRARLAKIQTFNQQLEPMTPASVGYERRQLLRSGVSRAGIDLGELSTKSQRRLVIPRKIKPKRDLSGDSD